MQLPEKIKPGDLWAITAPASPVEPEVVIAAQKEIEAWGFPVVVGKTCFEKKSYLAGTDLLRAKELNAFFHEPQVKAVLCLRGGYGSMRILSLLNYKMIKRNPKVFIGFSDLTALHMALQQQSQLITFHGPMAADIAKGLDIQSQKSLLDAIMRTKPSQFISLALLGKEAAYLNTGIGEGQLVGGNLSMVTATLGTPYEINTNQKILFLEEVHEEMYQIDRMITQLDLASKLKEAAGFLIGNFGLDKKTSRQLKRLLLKKLIPLGKPILYGIQAGHCQPNLTIPLGVTLKLDSSSTVLKSVEGVFSK